MGKANIMLEYGREGTTYHGMLRAEVAPTKGYALVARLEGLTFAQLMTRLARELRAQREWGNDVKHVELHRLELEGSVYAMAPSEIAQLIEDPAAAIRSMHEPDRTVVVRDLKKPTTAAERELVHPRLRAGHDTLADAFGDWTYLRMRSEQGVECPFCGRWTTVYCYFGGPFEFLCGACSPSIAYTVYGEPVDGWFKVKTSELLIYDVERYFLPRRWNKSGPWISHEELKQMYETFCKERDDAVGCGR
jgi:hypothetical protein